MKHEALIIGNQFNLIVNVFYFIPRFCYVLCWNHVKKSQDTFIPKYEKKKKIIYSGENKYLTHQHFYQ